MARNKAQAPESTRDKYLVTVEEVLEGIKKLQERISQLGELKTEGNPYWDAQRVSTQFAVRHTIREIFGEQSAEYHELKGLRLRAERQSDLDETAATLQKLIENLEDKQCVLEGKPIPKRVPKPAMVRSSSQPTTKPVPAPKASPPPPPPTMAKQGQARVPFAADPLFSPASFSTTPSPSRPERAIPEPSSRIPTPPPPTVRLVEVPEIPSATPGRPTSSASPRPAVMSGATDPLSVLQNTCARFHAVARHLRRREDRSTLEVEDEQDVQDVIHMLLYLAFDEIGIETDIPRYAGASERTDLLLRQEGLLIIVKKTRQGFGGKEVASELAMDAQHYASHPTCRTLFCFVYDPEGRIGDPRGLEGNLMWEKKGQKIVTQVEPK